MSMMNGYDGCNNKNDYLCVGERYRFLSLHFTVKSVLIKDIVGSAQDWKALLKIFQGCLVHLDAPTFCFNLFVSIEVAAILANNVRYNLLLFVTPVSNYYKRMEDIVHISQSEN